MLVRATCEALDAVNRRDAKALGALMADDYAIVTASGRYLPGAKDAMVRRWTEPPAPGTTAESRLLAVHRVLVRGDLGFVSGLIEDRGRTAAGNSCLQHAFTDTWERRSGRWLWVHSHESGGAAAPCVP